MSIKLHELGFRRAKMLAKDGKAVFDEGDAWGQHQPSADDENAFIESRGYEEYGRWHLGVDETKPEDTKARYTFRYGDFRKVHRCAVVSVESQAAASKDTDIENAATHLRGLLDSAPR